VITVITICYIGCVFVAFKVIKIKVTPTAVAVATLIGVFMLGGIVIGWKQSAPITGQMFLRRYVLQIVPDARELVSKVLVESNQPVKMGDPLFSILPDRYQHAVDQSTADLAAAKSTVSQLEASVNAGEAAVKKSKADTAISKAELDTALHLQKTSAGAIAKLKVEETQDAYLAAQADDKVAEATLKQTRFSLTASQRSVDVAQASLNTANFNLARCTYTSPVDGLVMNFQMEEGVPVARWRFTSTGTVMDMSDTAVAAVFPQNLLKNVEVGNHAEIAFKSMPGQVVAGKVDAIIKYTGEGQFMPTGYLPEAASVGSKGFLVVRIRLDDEDLAKKLPLGAAGTTAIYTDVGKPFHLISKITVRINGWMNYLPF
jgi:multidrug resistance efflux pump